MRCGCLQCSSFNAMTTTADSCSCPSCKHSTHPAPHTPRQPSAELAFTAALADVACLPAKAHSGACALKATVACAGHACHPDHSCACSLHTPHKPAVGPAPLQEPHKPQHHPRMWTRCTTPTAAARAPRDSATGPGCPPISASPRLEHWAWQPTENTRLGIRLKHQAWQSYSTATWQALGWNTGLGNPLEHWAWQPIQTLGLAIH